MEPTTSNNDEVKKEDSNDEVFADDQASLSRKRRSNSVIDSIGSGVVLVGGGNTGETMYLSPEGGATSRPKSQSTPDTSMLACERNDLPDSTAANVQPDVIKRVTDKVDAHVKIHDEPREDPRSEDSSESAIVTALMPVTKDADRYNMGHKNRGMCVIFNHEEFESGFDKREGSTIDAMRLQKTFGNLGFDVKVYDNLTFKEVSDVLNELSTKTDHTENDCICIIVLTHGLQNDMISAKDAAYKVDKLWKPFLAYNCPTLAGKPKLFFVQACRGDEIDNGVVLSPRAAVSSTDSVSSYKIPTHADILIAHSSAQGFYTWRNPTDGTWYISCLCEILDKYGTKLDLLSMLTMTARKVATDYASYDPTDPSRHEKKQVPSLTSLLLRAVYFSPKTNV